MLKETKSFGATSGMRTMIPLRSISPDQKNVWHVEFHSHNPKAPGNKS